MSKPSGQRSHKAEIEARRARGGYEAKRRATHPQREARRQAAAYRLANPLAPAEPDAKWTVLLDELRYAKSYRTW